MGKHYNNSYLTFPVESTDTSIYLFLCAIFSFFVYCCCRIAGRWFKEEYLWEAQPLCQAVNHAITTTSKVMETAPWPNC